MATRSNDLTEFAKPVADELAEKCGSLKRVLSASVLCLKDCTPEVREYYMSKAIGKNTIPLPDDEIEKLWTQIEKIAEKVGVKINMPKRKRG